MLRRHLPRLFLAALAVSIMGATPALALDHTGMDHGAAAGTATAGLTAAAPASGSAGAQAFDRTPLYLSADMSGEQEVPVPGKPAVGAPGGRAIAQVEVKGNRVIFAFRWAGISAPTLGHIHQGGAGVNGDVVVPLFADKGMPATATAAAGVVTVSDPSVATAIRSNPTGFYLNLHTAEFPGGAVRGQLTPVGHAVDPLGIVQSGPQRAFLSGDQEVPVAGKPAVGDPDGRAIAFIRPAGNQLEYSAAWVGVAPILGHIHQGEFGVNGPVVVPLFTTPVPSTIIALSGTVTNVDPALLAKIQARPTDFYANLHTTDFPGGAVRGQLYS